ncbi:MAG: 4'-phosphopantetheinyl transferase superfamily protein [Clostridia bacterium]|nr:4'-phosphopantetheinyl transferase superfamily protein [Clostridia bacterium]
MRTSTINQSIYSAIEALPFGEDEKIRLRNIKNHTSLKNSLGSLLCLKKILDHLGFQSESYDLTIARDSNGKPYFLSLPLHFSISHSQDLAIVALSDQSIGVDIEFIDARRDINAISERFFAPDEHLAICESKCPADDFFALWTKKEAFAKLSGKGLSSICSKQSIFGAEYTFKEYRLISGEDNACLTVCFKSNDLDFKIDNPYKEITLYEIQN